MQELSLRMRQTSLVTAKDQRPPRKFKNGTSIQFRQLMGRFYSAAASQQGMTPKDKLIELAHWFEGTANTIIEAYISWSNAEEAYHLCMSELETMYGQEADSVIPSLQQAARGRQLVHNDYDGHCQLYANLRGCQALAKSLHTEYELNRDDILNSILENRLGHMASNIFMDRQRARRERGIRFGFDQLMLYLSDWVTHLQRQRSTSGYTTNANVASTETVAKPPPVAKSPQTESYAERVANSPMKTQPTDLCAYCGSVHRIEKCASFAQLAPDDKVTKIRERRLCFHCFSAAHGARACPTPARCATCQERHHTLLHGRKPPPPPRDERNRF